MVLKSSFIMLFILCLFSASAFAAPKVGERALDFSLKEISGGEKKYSLSDFKGRVILLNIWASWCSGCKEEMPHFIDLQQSYDKNNFLIVAASIDKKASYSLNFLKKLEQKTGEKINFLVLVDTNKQIAKDYNPFGLPASYLINKDGIIIKSFYGSLKESSLEILRKNIEILLKEEE